MNFIHLLLTMGWVAVGLEQVVQEATCSNAGSGERCTSEEPQTEDVNVLLQRAAMSVDSASVRDGSPSGSASLREEYTEASGKHTQLSQLDSAANMLSDVLLGNVPKSEVEIVLAHYDEDIDWSNPYSNIRTIYCKGPVTKRPHGCTHLENVGREGHTFLYHIVHNYDKLSQWTVFTQAQAPTNGYRGHRLGGGHALPGVPFDSYVLPEAAGGLSREDGTAFVFTGAVHMPTLNHSLRLSYMGAARSPTLHQQSKCPKTELLDGWQQWWDLGWFKTFIGGRCKVAPQDVPKAFNEYWDNDIKLPKPKSDIIFFTQGARFAASRERIQERPKAFYEVLLAKLDKDLDPCHNYFNEWIWYYIVGKPDVLVESPCSVDLVLSEANNKYQDDEMLFEEMEKIHGKGTERTLDGNKGLDGKPSSRRWKATDAFVEQEAHQARGH